MKLCHLYTRRVNWIYIFQTQNPSKILYVKRLKILQVRMNSVIQLFGAKIVLEYKCTNLNHVFSLVKSWILCFKRARVLITYEPHNYVLCIRIIQTCARVVPNHPRLEQYSGASVDFPSVKLLPHLRHAAIIIITRRSQI